MSVYVVDASIAAKWFLDETHTTLALRLINERDRLHAPDFLLLEFDSIIWRRIVRNELAVVEGHRMRREIRTLPMEIHRFHSLLDLAYDTAVETRQSIYDCLYLALAISLHGRVVTADRRFWQGIARTPLAPHILWVEQIP